jgi:sialic acid synthase SpsE
MEIIAECGASHGGSLPLAKELAYVAKQSGANSAKFQMGLSELAGDSSPQKDIFSRLEFTDEQWIELKEYCDSIEMDFSASCWSERHVDLLNSMNPKYIKIGSGDATFEPILKKVSLCNKNVYLSVGMCTEEEIYSSLKICKADILFLCTVSYPTPIQDCHLARLRSLLQFKNSGLCTAIGYSNHTDDWRVPVFATQLGAEAVEAHLSLEEYPSDGSLSARDFKQMVKEIYAGNTRFPLNLRINALGSGGLGVISIERPWLSVARRSPITGKREFRTS